MELRNYRDKLEKKLKLWKEVQNDATNKLWQKGFDDVREMFYRNSHEEREILEDIEKLHTEN